MIGAWKCKFPPFKGIMADLHFTCILETCNIQVHMYNMILVCAKKVPMENSEVLFFDIPVVACWYVNCK